MLKNRHVGCSIGLHILFLQKNDIMRPSSFFILFSIATCLYPVCTKAQVRCVVIDKETGLPLRDVKAYTDKGGVFTTDYQGRLAIDSVFSSATLVHESYLQRKVQRAELRDTLWLLPKAIRLDEVVVWGTARKGSFSWMQGAMEQAAATATPPPRGVASFDFFELFRKKPLSKKARKKNKQVLSEWDKE